MVEALFNGLIKFFLFLINIVGSIFIYPIQAILVTLVPSVGDFLDTVLSFFNDSVFPFLCWLKQVLITITCCPPALFSLIISTFFLFLTISLLFRSFSLIYRIYFLVRGSKA